MKKLILIFVLLIGCENAIITEAYIAEDCFVESGFYDIEAAHVNGNCDGDTDFFLEARENATWYRQSDRACGFVYGSWTTGNHTTIDVTRISNYTENGLEEYWFLFVTDSYGEKCFDSYVVKWRREK